ncbi:MAG: hypothetical protein ACRD33_11095, partial [Candidatus Acidiferrales bacterium]
MPNPRNLDLEMNAGHPINASRQGTASAVPKTVATAAVLTPEVCRTDALPVFETASCKASATALGIYVQVPFCQTKCTYCNFHTGVVARSLYRPYVDAVCREISQSRALRGVTVDTVYLGGGTPSLLEPADLALITDAIRRNYACHWNEVTLEADP